MSTAFTCPHCQTALAVGPGGPPVGSVCPRCNRPLHASAVAPGAPPPPVVLAVEPRRRDDRDEPREVLPAQAPAIPGPVKAAGIIWIIFGGLILLNGIVAVLLLLSLARGPAGAYVAGGVCGVGFVALIGGAFILVGVQSLSGSARDTLGNGIGSIIFAALIGGSGLLRLVAVGMSVGELIAAAINLVAGAGLLVAGILALNGREAYRRYRHYHQDLAYERRRRERYE